MARRSQFSYYALLAGFTLAGGVWGALYWLSRTFGPVKLYRVLFYMQQPLEGVATDLVWRAFFCALLIPLTVAAVLVFALTVRGRRFFRRAARHAHLFAAGRIMLKCLFAAVILLLLKQTFSGSATREVFSLPAATITIKVPADTEKKPNSAALPSAYESPQMVDKTVTVAEILAENPCLAACRDGTPGKIALTLAPWHDGDGDVAPFPPGGNAGNTIRECADLAAYQRARARGEKHIAWNFERAGEKDFSTVLRRKVRIVMVSFLFASEYPEVVRFWRERGVIVAQSLLSDCWRERLRVLHLLNKARYSPVADIQFWHRGKTAEDFHAAKNN